MPTPAQTAQVIHFVINNLGDDNGHHTFEQIPQVAERLGTSERFSRRLIEERRIEFKRFGRHIRIAESALNAYIEACTVAPIRRRNSYRRVA